MYALRDPGQVADFSVSSVKNGQGLELLSATQPQHLGCLSEISGAAPNLLNAGPPGGGGQTPVVLRRPSLWLMLKVENL